MVFAASADRGLDSEGGDSLFPRVSYLQCYFRVSTLLFFNQFVIFHKLHNLRWSLQRVSLRIELIYRTMVGGYNIIKHQN